MMKQDDAELIGRLALAAKYLRVQPTGFLAEIDAGSWARLLEQAEVRLRELAATDEVAA